MIYPNFLRKGQMVGITAPSCGILDKEKSYDFSISKLKDHGFLCRETKNVRTAGKVSSSPKERVRELMELIEDPEIHGIICAAGGDFLMEMLPLLDFDKIKSNPKWIQGYSDPTGLLHSILVNCEMASIYGPNAGGYDMEIWHESLEHNLSILQGGKLIQKSFSFYQSGWKEEMKDYVLDTEVAWKTPNGAVDESGRFIGGCLDCLCNLVGTSVDRTAEFVRKYSEEGFIWYFDIFSLTAENTYRALWQMKEAGWFAHVRAIIVGRIRFPGTTLSMSYQEGFQRLFGELPLIMEADIGHVKPAMTLINGGLGRVKASDGVGEIQINIE